MIICWLTTLLFCSAAVFGEIPGDDRQYQEDCFRKCSLTKECRVLQSFPEWQVFPCEEYAGRMCGNSYEEDVCLEKLQLGFQSRCPKVIFDLFVPCVSCDIKCQIGKGTKKQTNIDACIGKCSITKACVFAEKSPLMLTDACDKYLEKNCMAQTNPVACLEREYSEGQPKCPERYLGNIVACVKCDMQCEEDYLPAAQQAKPGKARVKACFDECSKTPECKAMEITRWKMIKPCSDLAERTCENTEDESSCLDGLVTLNQTACSRDVLGYLVSCMKCDVACGKVTLEEEPNEGPAVEPPESTPCIDECSETDACVAFDAAPWNLRSVCGRYVMQKCEKSDTAGMCLDGLQTDNQTLCSEDMLGNMIPCMKCELKCDEATNTTQPGTTRGIGSKDTKNVWSAKDDCSDKCIEKGVCVAVEATPWKTSSLCLKFAFEMCGNLYNPTTCLKDLQTKNETKCPREFLENMIPCMECDIECKAGENKELECYDQCTGTKECKLVDGASEKQTRNCENFVERKCGRKKNIVSCMENIADEPNVKCPIKFRKNLVSCMKCDYTCENPEEETKGNATRIPRKECLYNCGRSGECPKNKSPLSRKCKSCVVKKCGRGQKGSICEKAAVAEDCRSKCSGATEKMMEMRKTCVDCEAKCS